jgi:RNA polymerase sigma-70 factor (ECF subfamily)
LATSAIALASAVVELMPGEGEARALLALLVLQNSRRDARVATDGRVLTLEEQDRSLWHRDEIARGLALVPADGGAYALQAEIAACHARAASADETDWAEIVRLYDVHLALSSSPVVELNRAIAIGMRDGPDAGLELLAHLDLEGYRWLPAAQGDLLRRAGRNEDAALSFRAALELTPDGPERTDLERRLAELGS